MKNKRLYADISLFLVAMIWGGGFIAVKDALNSMPPFQIMTMRFGIAVVLMSVVFWKRVKNINKKDIMAGFIIGIFLFGGFAFQTIGLKYTMPGKQAFLTATYVVMVPFLCWIFIKKKPGIYEVISVLLAFFGIGFLTLQGKLNINIGDILTLICAVFFAAQIIAIDFYTEKHSAIVLTIVQLATATILSTVCSLSIEKTVFNLNYSVAFAILYLGVFSTMLAFMIQNVAQKYTVSTHAAIILSLESLFGFIFSVIFLKEIFTYKTIIGCILIFIAIIISETKDQIKRYISIQLF